MIGAVKGKECQVVTNFKAVGSGWRDKNYDDDEWFKDEKES